MCDYNHILETKRTQDHQPRKQKDTYDATENDIWFYTAGMYENAGAIRKSQLDALPDAGSFLKAQRIEQYILKAKAYPSDKLLYHGVEPDEKNEQEKFPVLNPGDSYPLKKLASYTSNIEVAIDGFALITQGDKVAFVLIGGTPLGTSIKHLSKNPDEDEVLLSGANILKISHVKTFNAFSCTPAQINSVALDPSVEIPMPQKEADRLKVYYAKYDRFDSKFLDKMTGHGLATTSSVSRKSFLSRSRSLPLLSSAGSKKSIFTRSPSFEIISHAMTAGKK